MSVRANTRVTLPRIAVSSLSLPDCFLRASLSASGLIPVAPPPSLSLFSLADVGVVGCSGTVLAYKHLSIVEDLAQGSSFRFELAAPGLLAVHRTAFFDCPKMNIVGSQRVFLSQSARLDLVGNVDADAESLHGGEPLNPSNSPQPL